MESYSTNKCGISFQSKQITYSRPRDTERAFDVMRQLFNVSLNLLFQNHVLGRLDIKEDESTNLSVTYNKQYSAHIFLLINFAEDTVQLLGSVNTRLMLFVFERDTSLRESALRKHTT